MEALGWIFLIGVVLWAAYVFVQRTATEQAEKIIHDKQKKLQWNELTEASLFIDEKSFDEMTLDDFSNAQKVLRRIGKSGEGIHPDKLKAIMDMLYYVFVQKMVPSVREKEPAHLSDRDLDMIKDVLMSIYEDNNVVAVYLDSLKRSRKAQLIMLKNPEILKMVDV